VTPHYADDWLTVYQGDAATVLRELPAESVHCVMTSPPYWGLRDYGVPGQLGLEPTPEKYVANMVGVFREVRRVLRKDGTLWLNMGDSYVSSAGERVYGSSDNGTGRGPGIRRHDVPASGLKPKDLVGIPWRLAFALQADGWYLRKRIVWCKPNPMPESVADRPTSATEDLFLLSRSPRYFYDAEAVREGDSGQDHRRAVLDGQPSLAPPGQTPHTGIRTIEGCNGSGRNLRDWWVIATEPYPGAHFATFPRKLVEPCIKAGTSERGVCPECGAPWVRESVTKIDDSRPRARQNINPPEVTKAGQGSNSKGSATWGHWLTHETTGWRSSCAHEREPVPAVVLDPFAGTGTVGLVAQSLSRRAILIDLSTEYMGQLLHRNRQTPLGLGA